jgi:hypothetical protein
MDSTENKDTDSALDVLSCAVMVIMWVIAGLVIGMAIGAAMLLIFPLFILWASGSDYSTAILYSIIGFIIGIAIVILVIPPPQSPGGKK